MNSIAQIRYADGRVVSFVDWSDLPLYSSADMQSGFTQQEISLFQYLEGDQVPGAGTAAVTRRTATRADTNLATNGSMASTEEMLVYSIKPDIQFFTTTDGNANDFTTRNYVGGTALPGMPNPTLAGLAALNHHLLLQLIVSEKVYAESPIGYFNSGYGPFGTGNTGPSAAPAVSRNLATQGLPSQEAVRKFAIPHHIGATEKYRVVLANAQGVAVNFGVDEASPPVNGGDVMATMRIILEGLYKRPTA